MIRDHHEWKTFVHGSQHACCPRPFLVAVRSTATTDAVILGLESSCDETAAAVVSTTATCCRRRRRLAGRGPRALRRRRAGARLAQHLDVVPVIREALAGGRPARRHRRHRRHAGPGLVGALLVGVAAAKAIAWARGKPLVGVHHLEGHLAALFLGARPLEPPFVAPARLRRSHVARSRERPTAARRARRDPRRRRRRGVRQGREAARPRLSRAGAVIDRLAPEGDPDAFRFPVAREQARTSRSAGSRPRCFTTSVPTHGVPMTSRSPIYARAIRPRSSRSWSARPGDRGATGAIMSDFGGVAANSALRAALRRGRLRVRAADRAVHRQRRDDRRGGRASPASIESPGYLGLDAYASV